MTPRASALCLLAALSCRAPRAPAPDVPDAPRALAARDVPPAPDAPPARDPELPPPVVTLASSDAAVDASLRLDVSPLAGDALRPRPLWWGDRVTAVATATVTLHDDARVELAPGAECEVAGHEGAALVLTRGAAALDTGPTSPVPARVDTPAGRVIVTGHGLAAVADDGATCVQGPAVVWPSPPAPPARVTRLSPAERRRRALASPGHPVLLDVELPELAAVALRPVASLVVPAGAGRAWSPDGAALAEAPRDCAAWASARARLLVRPSAHLGAVEALSRAGAGDVADARVALARRRVSSAVDGASRDRVEAALSLALGRLHARARRARALATRGGDVTALAQLAPFEALRDAARAR